VIRESVDLLDVESAEKLIRTIRLAESACGEKATLIVIDTFARSIPGGNENDAQDVGRAVNAADRIRTATGACVGFIHHAGKDTSKGARGSSALRAAADTEILTDGQTGTRTVAVTKQRDLPAGGRFAFELRQVVLGTDEDGETVTSCVVIEVDVPESPVVARIKGGPSRSRDG
jgi:RecA-family ATPase